MDPNETLNGDLFLSDQDKFTELYQKRYNRDPIFRKNEELYCGLCSAIKYAHLELFSLILKECDINYVNPFGDNVVMDLYNELSYEYNDTYVKVYWDRGKINVKDSQHFKIRLQMLELIFSKGFDIEILSSKNFLTGHKAVDQILINNGWNINHKINGRSELSFVIGYNISVYRTPIDHSCVNRCVEHLKFLFDNKIDPTIKDGKGRSALDYIKFLRDEVKYPDDKEKLTEVVNLVKNYTQQFWVDGLNFGYFVVIPKDIIKLLFYFL